MRKAIWCFVLPACLLLAACDGNPYEKAVRKNLGIEHVFARPTTAYGPGAVVMHEKKSGYTGVCLPEWIIGAQTPVISSIADISISKNSTIGFNINLNAEDKAKVGAEYENISGVTLTLVNGHQAEIMTDLVAAFSEIDKGVCAGNCRVLAAEHPESRFYFIRVAYAYDLDVKIKTKQGTTLSGEIPKEVLQVVGAKIGFNIESTLEQGLTGKGLYIGFNGTPRPVSTLAVAKGTVKLGDVRDPVVDITDLLK